MQLGQLQSLTSYSLLGSTNKISELVATAKKYDYQALGITDINGMYGVIEFYQTCLKEGIKPLIGLTLNYHSQYNESPNNRIVLLAKNLEGYHNLIQISTLKMEKESARSPFYLDDVSHYLSGLVGIIPWYHHEMSHVNPGEMDKAATIISHLKGLFLETDLYLGIAHSEGEELLVEQHKEWSRINDVPLIACQDVRYLHPNDDFAVRVLRYIDEGKTLDVGLEQVTGQRYLLTKESFEQRFIEAGLNEALVNNETLIQRLNVEIPLNQTLLPEYPLPCDVTSDMKLRELCYEGLHTLFPEATTEYVSRLEMELGVIHEMGYDDYFLIVWDVMLYAKNENIVTACRGSAAGSLVSYVLGITNVDPIAYDLLFERFLNKERYTMPDIDMDIPDNKRDQVLQYVNEKYGHNRVAQIATFGTLAAKMALRDVGRVFGLSQSEANNWSDAIPNTLKITLEDAYQSSNKLRELVAHSQKNTLLFETAKKIEGLPRHVSTHAAGVVISDQDLTHLIPLQPGSNEIPLTQFAMKEVEDVGLLKMDFLGLRNLSIIGNTLDMIAYHHGESIKLEDIPLNDDKTLELFRRGDTVGVFQFESAGIKNVLKKLKPTSIEDIASVNALYRPGPMQNIDLFIARKHGKSNIEYPHDDLKPILDRTYGIIVYQEQIMKVASLMAGFSLGEADILRRAISKKEKAVLDRERQHFISGSMKQGYTESIANEVYDYIEHFANYGFNRSHAVVYSVIAYQMAYLKVHYSTAFFTALLHSVRHNLGKIKEYVAEARRYGVVVSPPDINKSEYSFTMKKGTILFGFSALKGVRRDFIENILMTRKTGGNYKSLENFLIRIDGKWLKESNVLPLIYIGAFDGLHGNRKQLVMDLDGLIRNIEYSSGSLDLLDILSLKKEVVPDYSVTDKLNQEVEYLGTYLSGHPVDSYDHLLPGRNITAIADLLENQVGSILCYVISIKKIRTKKGDSMAFLKVNDASGEMDITVFPKLYRQVSGKLIENSVVMIEGKVEKSKYNQTLQVIANTVELADHLPTIEVLPTCFIKIDPNTNNNDILLQLRGVLNQYKGRQKVVLVYTKEKERLLLDEVDWVYENDELKERVEKLLGAGAIVFK